MKEVLLISQIRKDRSLQNSYDPTCFDKNIHIRLRNYKEDDIIKNIIVLEDKYGKETNDEDRGYTGTELNIQYEIMVDDYVIPVIMYNESKEKDEIKLNEREPIEEYDTEDENPTFDTTFGEFNLNKVNK